jgi:LPXTG-motif cell wall-anchored protein
MLRSSIARPLSIAVGAGTALTAFGVATPAGATADCSAGVTVNATEAAIRAAITAGETVICVNAGTIDMSSTGVDASAEPFVVEDADLTLIALGTVVLDGGDEQENAIRSGGSLSEDLTVDGFTFSNFFATTVGDEGIVALIGTTGVLTVVNSTFTDNMGYATVEGWGGSQFPSVVVDNSVFENNLTGTAQIRGKSDVTVTNSIFMNNGFGSQISVDVFADDPTVVISGNFFGGNAGDNPVVYVPAGTALIANNTFAANHNDDDSEPSVLWFEGGQLPVIAFNTFIDNSSDANAREDVMIENNTDAALLGNIWVSAGAGSLGKSVDSDASSVYIDYGGNFSTTNESALLDDPSSYSNVAESALDLGDIADNGGPTYTAALGADSIAIDAVSPAVAAAIFGESFAVDQRGNDRVGDIDAGAFEFDGLANTGVAATGLAVTGGVLAAAGAALVARRRRKA